MAEATPPPFVKYFVAVLYLDSKILSSVKDDFIAKWGSIDYESDSYPFDSTDYYNLEMGGQPKRIFLTFEKLYFPDLLVEMKLWCNDLEVKYSVDHKRTVNCDAGYLDHNKIVLASAKEAGQKIYLSQGIYADLVARYKKGNYQPFEWTFPDFKSDRYQKELLIIRQNYLMQIKRLKT